MPTLWIGASLAESRASCEGCAQLEAGNCYSRFGSPSFALASIARAARRAKSWRRYSLEAALRNRAASARLVRLSAIGDAANVDRAELISAIERIEREGLQVNAFTHFWRQRRNARLRKWFMASCDSFEDARDANARGWRAAIVAPFGTTGTIRNDDGSIFAVECPAIAAARFGKEFTCNDCAASSRGVLCSGATDAPNVYFADHGPKTRGRKLPVIQ